MKSTRYLLTAALTTLLALAACTSEDDVQNNPLPEGAVDIRATIDGVRTRSPQLDADGSGTFGTGDKWGMYTFTSDAASPTYSNQNIAYQADNSSPLYWEELGDGTVTFSAYYPRITADIADPTAYVYMPYSNTVDADLLHATATASKGGTVALNFKHLMHRLVINLTAGEGMSGRDLSTALINSTPKIGAATMLGSIEVNLLTGTVNYGDLGAGADHSNRGRGNADWIVVPQDLTAGADWLRITVGEDVWYYTVPARFNTSNPAHPTRLESGKRLTLNLTLKKSTTGQTKVELTSSAITGWDTQGKIEDEVVIGGGDTQAAYTALIAAIDGASTDAGNPTEITLMGDINMGDNGAITIGVNGTARHIVINGSGNKITLGSKNRVLNVQYESSLTLKNIIIDGGNTPADFLVTASYYSTITLGDGAVLQNLKNLEFPCEGVSLETGSTLIMNSGASIKNMEGYAIHSRDISILNRIIFNGGSLSGNQTDIFVKYLDTNEASIQIADWPTLDGDGKMNVQMGNSLYTDACLIAAPKDGYSSLSLDKFNFSIEGLSGNATDLCDIWLDNTDGIIKIKQK